VLLRQVTLSAYLSARASIAAAIEGAQMHALLLRTGFVSNLYVTSALIDMFSNRRRIKEAYLVFFEIEDKNIV